MNNSCIKHEKILVKLEQSLIEEKIEKMEGKDKFQPKLPPQFLTFINHRKLNANICYKILFRHALY